MANAVVVTVSSKVVGSGFVVPYNHHEPRIPSLNWFHSLDSSMIAMWS